MTKVYAIYELDMNGDVGDLIDICHDSSTADLELKLLRKYDGYAEEYTVVEYDVEKKLENLLAEHKRERSIFQEIESEITKWKNNES